MENRDIEALLLPDTVFWMKLTSVTVMDESDRSGPYLYNIISVEVWVEDEKNSAYNLPAVYQPW
jgi:hypothetical protein